MHTCPACGFLSMHQEINAEKSTLACPQCGAEAKAFFLPIFFITGGAGCGKSTAAMGLKSRLPCIVFEPDLTPDEVLVRAEAWIRARL